MNYRFNAAGAERKRLVQAVARTLEVEAKYLGMPSMAYEIGPCNVGRDGTLSFSGGCDAEKTERVLEALLDEGFECETEKAAVRHTETRQEPAGLTITLPLDGMDSAAVDRLSLLVNSKAGLIRKALGAAKLDINPEYDKGRIQFPWFDRTPSLEELEAISVFMNALCGMAKNARRVTAKEKETGSEKYAFRCFLLRLGFIGDEYKSKRKTLLKNLSGSSAFRDGRKGDGNDAISQ